MFDAKSLVALKDTRDWSFSGLRVREDGARLIADSLKSCKSVTSLNMQKTFIGDEGVRFVSSALRLSSITLLDLGSICKSRVSPPSSVSISICIAENDLGNPGTKVLSEALKTNKVLTNLQLRNNMIGEEGAEYLSEALKFNSSLTNLNLRENEIGIDGTSIILEALDVNTTLSILDIGGNALEDPGAEVLGTWLKTNNTVTSLDIRGNSIGDPGFKQIATALRRNSTLTTLNLGWNSLSDESSTYFLSSIVDNCNSMSESSISACNSAVEHNKVTQQQLLSGIDFDSICVTGECRNALANIVERSALTGNCNVLSLAVGLIQNHKHHWLNSTRLGSCSLIDDSSRILSVMASCKTLHVALQLMKKGCVFIDQFQSWHASELLCILMEREKSEDDTTQTLVEFMARIWAKAGNWDAVNVAVSFSGGVMKFLDLSNLALKSFPPLLCEGLLYAGCTSLDVSANLLETLPSSLHEIPEVTLDGNPLSLIPESFRHQPWSKLSQFLKYNGVPVCWWNKKLLMVGEEAAGKTTLLKCLAKRKAVNTGGKNVATDGIAVQKEFKMTKTGKFFWTAWDLGGQEVLYPSHQFFLTSDSVYLLLFNIAAISQELALLEKESASANHSAPQSVPPSMHRVIYWLKQIKASQRSRANSVAPSSPQITVIVGTHMDQVASDDAVVSSLLYVINRLNSLFKQDRMLGSRGKSAIAGSFALSTKTGDGLTMNPSNPVEAQYSSTGVADVASYLEELCCKTVVQVPKTWETLYNHITKKSKSQPTMYWNEFVLIALNSRVGTGTAEVLDSAPISSVCEQSVDWQEINMCSDFLADSGAIIHFRFMTVGSIAKRSSTPTAVSVEDTKATLAQDNAPHALSDIVVLKPQWLSDVMKTVITISGSSGWLSNGFLEKRNLKHVFSKFHSDMHNSLLELLQLFEIAHCMSEGKILIPCLLPSLCPLNDSSTPWCPFFSPATMTSLKPIAALSSREFELPFIPIGFFSRFTVRLLGIPGLLPLSMWKSGLILQFSSTAVATKVETATLLIECTDEQQKHCLSIQVFSADTHGEGSEVRLKSDVCMMFANVISAAMAFIRSCYPSIMPDVVQVFPCSYCAARKHRSQCSLCKQSASEVTNLDSIHVFSLEDCIAAVKSGHGNLHCPSVHSTGRTSTALVPALVSAALTGSLVPIAIVAPDIALSHLPVIAPADLVVAHSAFAQGGYGKVMKGEWRGNMVAVKEPHSQEGLAEFVYEAGIMNTIGHHRNLVRFYGVCLQPQIRLVMEFIHPVTKCNGRELSLKKPDLHNLISFILELSESLEEPSPSTTATTPSKSQDQDFQTDLQKKRDFMESILPSELRKKIMLDIACGLAHLHNQSPPLVHSDLHAGNIFICSLEMEGSGPWAKISDFGLSEFLYGGTTADIRPEMDTFAPEVLKGAKHDTKADIWCYGILLRQLNDPFTSPFSHLYGNPLYSQAQLRLDHTTGLTRTQFSLRQDSVRKALIEGLVGPSPPMKSVIEENSECLTKTVGTPKFMSTPASPQLSPTLPPLSPRNVIILEPLIAASSITAAAPTSTIVPSADSNLPHSQSVVPNDGDSRPTLMPHSKALPPTPLTSSPRLQPTIPTDKQLAIIESTPPASPPKQQRLSIFARLTTHNPRNKAKSTSTSSSASSPSTTRFTPSPPPPPHSPPPRSPTSQPLQLPLPPGPAPRPPSPSAPPLSPHSDRRSLSLSPKLPPLSPTLSPSLTPDSISTSTGLATTSGNYKLVPVCPQWAHDIMLKCFLHTPEERPTAQQLIERLANP
ncbi:Protein NLRC3 [Pelomyxa schiedti]|nr:Protein NLRC3 [Pelomyxa schiedti]